MKKTLRCGELLVAVLFVSQPVWAQSELETVIVSATRSSDNVLAVPNNISVIGQEQLTRTQAEHIQQALSAVPGVSLQRGDGQESLPGIRSAVLTGAGACGNVLVMEEGIPVRGPAFCNVNELFDTHFENASQVEVTRGPSTAFYGSNALLGSVNIVLPRNASDFIAVELGQEDYRRFKGKYDYGETTPGSASGRIFATVTDAGSFREQASYKQQKISWRHEQMVADWRLDAGATVTRLDQETAGFIIGEDSYLDEQLSRENLDPEAFRKTDSFRAWAKLSRETGSGNTVQISPYVRATDMDFLLHFLPGDPLEQNQQTGFGWQSSLRGEANDQLRWAIGFDADFSDGELRQFQAQTTPGSAFLQETVPAGLQYDYQVDSQQVGVFGHLDWQFNDQWQLLAGARFERLDYDYDNRTLTGRTREDGSECDFGGCRYSRPADRQDSFTNVSPKLELIYKPTDELTIYAAASSAFRAPQATELYRLQRAQQVADLDNVEATNVELGIAYRSNRTSFTVSAYQLDQDNVIIRDSDFFNTDGNELSSVGLEIALKHQLAERFEWRLAAALADHEYASDQLSGGVNINGNEVDTAPSSLLNTAIVWQLSDAISTEVELQHVGSYFLEPENQRSYPGHQVVNMRLQYALSPSVTASARVLNVTDKRYAERADFTGFTGERYFPGASRSLFLGLRYDFGR